VFATGWDSFWVQWDLVGPAFHHGQTPSALVSLFQMIVLVLPAAGLIYTTMRVVRQFGATGLSWSADSPARRGLLVAGTAAALGLTAFFWWPNGVYKPIQPTERGTLASAAKAFRDIPSGRAALTPQREQQLGGAPTERTFKQQGRERDPLPGQKSQTGDRTGAAGQAAGKPPEQPSAPGSQSQQRQPQGEVTTPGAQQPSKHDTTAPQDTTTTAPSSDQSQTTTTTPADPSAQGTQPQPGKTETTTTTPTSP
jgi:putative peptide zinc metalloprotease protein